MERLLIPLLRQVRDAPEPERRAHVLMTLRNMGHDVQDDLPMLWGHELADDLSYRSVTVEIP